MVRLRRRPLPDGNTLVVESTGHDERTRIDHVGYPHRDEMVLEERYAQAPLSSAATSIRGFST